MAYYVYVVLCEDDSLYTGYTKNVELRMRLHMKGKGAKYTKSHKPKKLIYIERVDSILNAMKRERQIKKLNHSQKLKLINSVKS